MTRANFRFVFGLGLVLGAIIALLDAPGLALALGVLGMLWGAVEED
jgi:hypothetical protein